MWFELLPSLIVVGAGVAVPQFLIYATNRLFLKTPYKREVVTYNDFHCYLRDMRISQENNAYKQIGLECLCEPPPPPPPECTC